ncbi:hypothetical protein BDY24DRAFT_419267 [Mrakia frigida]|uniref:M20 family metallopeptidase n=1 Tax=Mrakia frigida TaxID=29902 RepID=UPI003FCBF9BC
MDEHLPSYSVSSTSSSPFPRNDKLLAKAQKIIDAKLVSIERELREVSLSIHDNPELGFQEHHAHSVLVAYLKKQEGWKVEGWPSMPTAFVATFEHGKGGRTMGFNSEYDALPKIGHACGHNLIAIIGVGAALSVAAALVELNVPGRVKLLGTPAEESGGGKVIFVKEGAYEDMTACMMAHPEGGRDPKAYPGNFDGGLGKMLAITGFTAEFKGKTAHAGANPYDGVNALDAVIEGYNAVSALRQQIPPDHRVHGVIKGTENYAQNIIPDTGNVIYGCRAPSSKQVVALRKRVESCFRAAALSTGCTVEIKTSGEYTYDDLHNSPTLASEYISLMTSHHSQTLDTNNNSTASTDFGNVTYSLPACHPGFKIPAPVGSSNHTVGFAEAAGTEGAHTAAIKVASGLAGVGMRVIEDEKFAKECKRVWKEWKDSI